MTTELICFTIKIYEKVKGEHRTLETLQINKSFGSEKEFNQWCNETKQHYRIYFNNPDIVCDFYTKRK